MVFPFQQKFFLSATMTFLEPIFSGEAFMPHGHCYFWDPFILWSHAISDTIIAAAYFIIPFSLVEIVRKRNDFRYIWMVLLFALFILGCGATHVMDVVVIWEPFYYTDSIIRIITALASIGTAVMLIYITPRLILIPSAEKWKKMNEELRFLNESLEEKVRMRTAALAESAATFEFVTDTIPQLVWTAPPDGKLDYFNQNWFDYTALSYENSKGEGWKSAIHESERQRVNAAWEHAVAQGEKFEMEFRLKHGHNGSYRWHLVRALAMKDEQGNVSKWFGTATDVHEQKQKSEELKKVNEELDSFVYTASHDLKAPLTNLEGLIRITEEKNHDDQARETVFAMVRQQLSQLKLVIRDLGDIGRIEKEAMEDFELVSLPRLIKEFKDSNQQIIQETHTRISAHLDKEEIFFSINSLRSLIHNLLDNAIKYRKQGVAPYLEISTRIHDEYWELRVRDNGIGIAPEHHEKVFDMFRRYHRTSKGTGIGLYIVRRISEKYGGGATVESEADVGSTFIVSIPREAMGKKAQTKLVK